MYSESNQDTYPPKKNIQAQQHFAAVKEISLNQVVIMGHKFYEKGSDYPFSGIIIRRYANGHLQLRFTVKNGIPHGYSEAWYENGTKFYEIPYGNGLKNGPYLAWHSNRQLGEVGVFKDGIRHGPYKYIFDNGQLGERGDFENGKINGIVIVWDKNGRKTKEIQYNNGVKGKTTLYHPNGSVEIFTLKNNQLHGLYEYWKNNHLTRREFYNQGIRHGKCEIFYETSGKKYLEVIYNHGTEESVKVWNESGQLIKQGKRKKYVLEERKI
jgi:antitoxin component YwqK of YwqJK toxin-antitoxin module